MNLPNQKGWEDVSVRMWKELRFLTPSDFDSITDFQIERFCILTDTDNEDDIWDVSAVELNKKVREFSWLNSPPIAEVKSELKGYKYKGLKGIKLGEYIDLEHWNVEGFVENIERIAAILYRKTKKGDWDEDVVEPYGVYSKADRAKEFEDLKVTDLYGVLVDYLDFRERFMEKYEDLFDTEEDDKDEEGVEVVERVTLSEEVRKDKERKLAKWAWERFIFDMCDKDVTKYPKVIVLPLVFVFNTLSMRQDLKI